LSEHRRVVDAVAHHRHARAAELQVADGALLQLGSRARDGVIDAELRRRAGHDAFLVTGEKVNPKPMARKRPIARGASSRKRSPILKAAIQPCASPR
jgi:hypothetical protein